MPIPVAIGDNIRLILKGRYGTSVITNNVFYAKVNSFAGILAPPPTLQDAGDGLWQTIKGALLPLTAEVVTFTEVVCESLDADANLVNGESYFIASGDGDGSSASEALPPSDAYTFKFVRPDSSKRHGFKRFPGVPEGANADGVVVGGALTALNSLAAILSGSFNFYRLVVDTETNLGGDFQLALVQRQLNGDVVSPAVFYLPSTVVFDKIGHQDSRDFGRGI